MSNLQRHNVFVPYDVRHVPDIFNSSVFYSGTPKSAEVVQRGDLEDYYLVSALSSMRLIEKVCEVLIKYTSFQCLQYIINLLFRMFETAVGMSSESSS